MSRSISRALAALLVVGGSGTCAAQLADDVVDRGKKATVLVQISHDTRVTLGSAFCIRKSGLFVTTAGVVEKAAIKGSVVRLVVDIGLKTQRAVRAEVLRRNDEVNLALLEAAGQSDLTPLELARDGSLSEVAEVYTFGYPLGTKLAESRRSYPEVTVSPSRITRIRKDKARSIGIDLDIPILPGASGGPILDAAGKVIGVAVATGSDRVPKPVIPAGTLAEFLATPGLVFEPPPLDYKDRARPVVWTIEVQPPTPGAKLPDGLSVDVTVNYQYGEPKTFTAKAAGDGVFQANVIPVSQDPAQKVALDVWSDAKYLYQTLVKDEHVAIGDKKFLLSELRFLFPGPSPRVETRKAEIVSGPIRGLGKARARVGQTMRTVDLNQAPKITVTQLQAPSPVSSIEALVQAKQGSKVLIKLRRRTALAAAPSRFPVATSTTVVKKSGTVPRTSVGSADPADEKLQLGGRLDVAGVPRGAGKAIRPPQVKIGAARLVPTAGKGLEAPLVLKIEDTISDVITAGGGRYLLLVQKDGHKISVFDVNDAAIVKTIPLASANVLVAAGASKILVAFPDEGLLQRWDLATFKREGGSRPLPIDGKIKAMAMGSDSDGPILAFWVAAVKPQGFDKTWLSLIDLDTLKVLRAASADRRGSASYKGFQGLSTSGGALDGVAEGPLSWTHLRASDGGALFGLWNSNGWPLSFDTLALHGTSLVAISERGPFAHVVPGPDDRIIYTGAGGRLDVEGKPAGGALSQTTAPGELMVPSSDPSYFLSVGGLAAVFPRGSGQTSIPGAEHVAASVHATADGARLLTVHGLDEMVGHDRHDLFSSTDFTSDKRFHLVPQAGLLITIPNSNDRLVLRRLNLDQALGQASGDYLAVAALRSLNASPGQKLETVVVARSKNGGITCSLADGPEGMTVTPAGEITWLVPKEQKTSTVKAVVSVGDRSGQEVLVTLMIYIR